MKILKLTAENVKKVSVVEITPNGSLVQIGGRNGAGKSTVLDAIWYALGGADNMPGKVIREGADKARIELDMGDYLVIRTITEKGGTLQVKSKDGARYDKPQTLLDKMLGDLTFDPLEFSRMKPSQQFERLRAIAGVGSELEAIEQDIKAAFDKRTDVNRDVASLASQVAAIVVPDGTPDEPVDVSAVITEGQSKGKENDDIRGAQALILDLEAEVMQDKEVIQAAQQRIDANNELISQHRALAEKPLHELTDLRAQVEAANATNRSVAEKQRKSQLEKQHKEKQEESEALTTTVEEGRQRKVKLIASAKMPVEGLGLEDGVVTYNGIPFAQASTAEQIKVSVAIAMAANPQVKVILVRDGSLLDAETWQAISNMAAEKDYQIWMEAVKNADDGVGIFMEDGHVAAVDGVVQEAPVQVEAAIEKAFHADVETAPAGERTGAYEVSQRHAEIQKLDPVTGNPINDIPLFNKDGSVNEENLA